MNEQDKKFYNSAESKHFNKLEQIWNQTGIKPIGYDDAKEIAKDKAQNLGIKLYY